MSCKTRTTTRQSGKQTAKTRRFLSGMTINTTRPLPRNSRRRRGVQGLPWGNYRLFPKIFGSLLCIRFRNTNQKSKPFFCSSYIITWYSVQMVSQNVQFVASKGLIWQILEYNRLLSAFVRPCRASSGPRGIFVRDAALGAPPMFSPNYLHPRRAGAGGTPPISSLLRKDDRPRSSARNASAQLSMFP